jgi:hypothetical protein
VHGDAAKVMLLLTSDPPVVARRSLTPAYQPRASRVARGVLAARSGAPLADRMTPKLVGCIR